MDLDISHLARLFPGIHGHLVPFLQLSFDHRAGDNSAKPLHGKHPVHRNAEWNISPLAFQLGQLAKNLLPQLLNSLPGIGGNLNQRSLLQKSALRLAANILRHQLPPIVVHRIDFGHHKNAMLDFQQR